MRGLLEEAALTGLATAYDGAHLLPIIFSTSIPLFPMLFGTVIEYPYDSGGHMGPVPQSNQGHGSGESRGHRLVGTPGSSAFVGLSVERQQGGARHRVRQRNCPISHTGEAPKRQTECPARDRHLPSVATYARPPNARYTSSAYGPTRPHTSYLIPFPPNS